MSDDHTRHHDPPWRVTRAWWVPPAVAGAIALAGLAGVLIP